MKTTPIPTPDAPRKRGRPRQTVPLVPPAQVAARQARGETYAQIAQDLRISPASIVRLLQQAKHETMTSVADRLNRFILAVNSGHPRAIALLDQWEPGDLQKITLDRHGQRPLVISGRLIREGTTQFMGTHPDRPHAHWWTVKVYEISPPGEPGCVSTRIESPSDTVSDAKKEKGTQYAVAIEYAFRLKGQVWTQQVAQLTDDPSGVILAYDPLEHLEGYPDQPQFDSRQEKLEQSSKLQYDRLVTQLLHDPL